MKRGDIYLVTLDPTQGREQQGHRPVLVISPQAFNEATKLPEILDEVMAKLAPIFE